MKAQDMRAVFVKWYSRLPRGWQEAVSVALSILFTLAIIAGYKLLIGVGHPYLIGLFPVIICAVFLRTSAAITALLLSAAFINVYEIPHAGVLTRLLATLIFLAEGLILVWVAASRRKARVELARSLAQRSQELARLQTGYDKLSKSQQDQTLSMEQMRSSNRVMLDTLERILGKPNR